jgi:NTE family protein
VGLALGSGAARGWAHIGVIRALAESGIDVECVAGTSIGSLVGAAFASGRMDSLETIVRELDWKGAMALLDMGLPRSGLLDGRNVTSAIRENVDSGDIQDLPLPFCAVSTNLVDGSEVRIREGDVIEAVRASISIPGVFTPVRRGEQLLADGGLVNPVPTGVAREMGAEYVIAVDLNHGVAGIGQPAGERHTSGSAEGGRDRDESAADRLKSELAAIAEKLGSKGLPVFARAREWLESEPAPNILEVVIASLNIMEQQITEMQLKEDPPDLLIRPELSHLRPMEFHRGEEAIREGHRAAREALEDVVGPEAFE